MGTLSQKCTNGGGGGAGEPRLACLSAFSSLSSWVEEGLSAMKGTVAVPGDSRSSSAGRTGSPGVSQGRALQPPFRPSESSAQAFDRLSRGLIPFSFRKAELLTTYLKCDFHN